MRPRFDHRGIASLDGEWEFFPRDEMTGEPDRITVPGLWEAQGWLDLDGVAWYRLTVTLDDAEGFWTLCLGAVMDFASVYVNGELVAEHDSPFTPVECDVTAALRAGDNEIAVRVYDPALDDPDHLLSAHGKQGWANHHFPSRPSLYMTYGGIWLPVTLRRHGPVVVDDVFVDGNPDDLCATVELANRSADDHEVRLGMRTVGLVRECALQVPAGQTVTATFPLGRTNAARWRPDDPVLHGAVVDALVDGRVSDVRTVRYGLRTIRIDGTRILVNDEPYRMKSVLVQGFHPTALYAEGSREEIVEEVLAAKAMGFNTVRLHIKAFDPVYLDVCDEVGMFVECDLPVAEPIDHEQMGSDTELARRCLRAIREQVRRDRNHPSVILWSAMNELTLDREGSHYWDNYEQFARTLAGEVMRLDPTRPCIENEWVEPEPERVFISPILTAHWYGRLHADYLRKLEADCARYADVGKPLYVTEFGDWGLPPMPALPDPPFWDFREVYVAGLAASLWPSSIGRFVTETQRYQGLSDRLQTEVMRRHDHIGGYCLTELTDVPHELNGLLDLHRKPKRIAVAEVTRANQTVLPMLALDSLVVRAGETLRAPLHVANDGPELADVEIEVRFGESVSAYRPGSAGGTDEASLLARFDEAVWATRIDRIEAYRAAGLADVVIVAPDVPGSHDLVLRLTSGGREVAENRYPVHVVEVRRAAYEVRVLGDGADTRAALEAVGAKVGERGVTYVPEAGLVPELTDQLRELLAAGETVVVLAQPSRNAGAYPVPAEIVDVQTVWGSTVFHFTTDSGALPSLPRRAVLVAEDSTIQATSVVTRLAGEAWPDEPEVIAYKPPPDSVIGRLVGSHRVGPGRLVVCQYRLTKPALAGDAAALAVLADLVTWAAEPPARPRRDTVVKEDGRSVNLYAWDES